MNIMILILTLGTLVVGLYAFLFCRINWLYRKRIDFIHTCSETIKEHINQDVRDIPPVTDIIEKSLMSWHKSFFCFWIWDHSKMVTNKELYNKYYLGEK